MNEKHSLIFLLLGLASLFIACQSSSPEQNTTTPMPEASHETGYDSVAAKKYGADDYGMKKYIFAFLKKGPNRDLSPEKASELQMAHLENISRLAEEGKLVLAGPFFGDGDLRGIYIFNVSTLEEAEQLTNTDPAIQAGSLAMELKEWYGSAAVMAINDIHQTLSKKQVTDE